MENVSSQSQEVGKHTVNSEIFAKVLFSRNLRSFVKIKSSRKGEITLSFTDMSKSCPFASQVCLLMLFAKIKFSRKFLNLQ